MGVDPKAKTDADRNGPRVGGRQQEEFKRMMAPPADMVGTAMELIVQLVEERFDNEPTSPPAKFSLAKMKGGDWCASTNDWTARVGLSAFAPTAGAAISGLAAKMVAGEPWKRLPDRG